MSMVTEDEIKRWTAKRESALVMEILQGKTLPMHPDIEEVRLVFFNQHQRDVFVANQLFPDNCC